MNISKHATVTVRLVATAAVVAASVAACGSNSTAVPSSSSPATTSGTSVSPISVPLGSEPTGTVTLSWDPKTQDVTAELNMVGFTPGSAHAMHIHSGSCAQQGAVVVPFPDVVADDVGAINSSVTSSQPSADGLAAGMLLNIHLAPSDQISGPESLGYTPISCGDITSAAPATLTMTPPPPDAVREGSGTMNYDAGNKTLTVTTTASGLAAGSSHAEHIHVGSCSAQGEVKYPLNDLVASPDGIAEATTVIQNVEQAPPATGWYLNVHLGSADQIEQNGTPTLYFQPILCGDINA